MRNVRVPLANITVAILIVCSSCSVALGQARELLPEIDEAISAVESKLRAQESGEQELTGVFQDLGNDPLRIYVRSVDPVTGLATDVLVADTRTQAEIEVPMLAGEVWMIRTDATGAEETIAEYRANELLLQQVQIQKLASAWNSQPEPRQPLTLVEEGFGPWRVLTGVFLNFTPRTVTLVGEYTDRSTRQVRPTGSLVEVVAGSQQELTLTEGVRWRATVDGADVAIYEPNAELLQVVDIGQLMAAWQRQTEPRLPMTRTTEGFVVVPILDDFIDPEGYWVSGNRGDNERLKIALSETGLLVELEDGRIWSFQASSQRLNEYLFTKTFDNEGAVMFTETDEPAKLTFVSVSKLELQFESSVSDLEPLTQLLEVHDDTESDDVTHDVVEDNVGEDRPPQPPNPEMASSDMADPTAEEEPAGTTRRLAFVRDRTGSVPSVIASRLQKQLDPEGIWVGTDPSFREQFTIYYSNLENANDGITAALTSGLEMQFEPSSSNPNHYDFVKTFDANGFPIYTRVDDQRVSLDFRVDGTAALRVGDTTKALVRDGTNDVRTILAAALIDDPQWEQWIASEQGGGTWKKWTAADRATNAIIEGFSGELLSSQMPSYRGFNVVRMDPTQLAQRPGVGVHTRIFKMPSDQTREWSMDGTEYRIPWIFKVKPQIVGRSDSQTSMFFSEYQRQSAMSAGVEVTPIKLGYSRNQSSLDSSNTVSVRASKWASEYWLLLHKQYAELSDQFVTRVKSNRYEDGQLSWQAEDYQAFFETYGTHYPIAILYGGQAHLEKFVSASKTAEALATSWNAGYEVSGQVGAKGVSSNFRKSVGFEESTATGSSEETSAETVSYSYSGGAGTSFDLWDIGEAKKLVPIKVYLRPIDEIMLAKLFLTVDLDEMSLRRSEIKRHLDVYLQDAEARRIAELRRSPLVFKVRVLQVVADETWDEGIADNDLEVYGSISLAGWKNGRAMEGSKMGPIFDRNVDEAQKVNKGQTLKISSQERVFVVPPVAYFDQDTQRWKARYELNKYKLGAQIALMEDDGDWLLNSNDSIRGSVSIPLNEVFSANAKVKVAEKSIEVDLPRRAGKITVKIQVRQVGSFQVTNPDLGLPILENLEVQP